MFLQTEVYVSSSPMSNPAGNAWYDNMLNHLRNAVAIIIVCSKRSIDRPWINFETGAGVARDVPVIPLIHSGLDFSAIRIPFSLLQAKQATDAQHLKDLLNSLAKVLGARPPKFRDSDVSDAITRIRKFESDYSMPPDVIQLYNSSRDAQIDIGNRIDNSKQRIVLCGVQFAVSLSDWRDDYLSALARGIYLDIVMLNPNSGAVSTTAISYGMSEDELQRECADSLEKAKNIRYEALAQGGGTVDIYLTDTLPRARYYIFDPGKRHGILMFTPYLEDLRSSQSPTTAYRGDSAFAIKYNQVCNEIIGNATKVA